MSADRILSKLAALRSIFSDNAMFYKDITQWLRNRTFTSLFFGLLVMAEVLCLLIMGTSEDISEPGRTLFYGLYLMLMVYAILIAYQGNALTGREFANRTFELFELSGMSLERMVGGKLLSMLYQFFFGFFCLVPFMFFGYMLGGLDFMEMIVGVLLAAFLAVPLYLVSLSAALTGRLKQVAMLVKIGSVIFVAFLTITMLISIFGGRSVLGELIVGLTQVFKEIAQGSPEKFLLVLTMLAIYVQVCLLFFYLCCDNISRENDSRETAIKVLTTTLILSWLGGFAIYELFFAPSSSSSEDRWIIAAPVFVAIMALGLRTFYNSVEVPVIVNKRHENATFLTKLVYPVFKPGLAGGCRTVVFLSIMSVVIFVAAFGAQPYAGLLLQAPWFLIFPYVLIARTRDLRYNYAGQRSIAVAAWVIFGAMVMMVGAWTRADLFGVSASSPLIMVATLLSPLSSMAVAGSRYASEDMAGGILRASSGILGIVIMYLHTVAVTRKAEAGETIVPTPDN